MCKLCFHRNLPRFFGTYERVSVTKSTTAGGCFTQTGPALRAHESEKFKAGRARRNIAGSHASGNRPCRSYWVAPEAENFRLSSWATKVRCGSGGASSRRKVGG